MIITHITYLKSIFSNFLDEIKIIWKWMNSQKQAVEQSLRIVCLLLAYLVKWEVSGHWGYKQTILSLYFVYNLCLQITISCLICFGVLKEILFYYLSSQLLNRYSVINIYFSSIFMSIFYIILLYFTSIINLQYITLFRHNLMNLFTESSQSASLTRNSAI